MAEKSRRWSPYAYCEDNPIRFVDPDGMMPDGYNPDQHDKDPEFNPNSGGSPFDRSHRDYHTGIADDGHDDENRNDLRISDSRPMILAGEAGKGGDESNGSDNSGSGGGFWANLLKGADQSAGDFKQNIIDYLNALADGDVTKILTPFALSTYVGNKKVEPGGNNFSLPKTKGELGYMLGGITFSVLITRALLPTPTTNPNEFKPIGNRMYVHEESGAIYIKSYTSHGNPGNAGEQWKVYPRGTKDFSKTAGNRTTIDFNGKIVGK